MRTQDVHVELALDADGNSIRRIPVSFVRDNTQAQAEVSKDGCNWLVYHGVWLIPCSMATSPAQFRLGREIRLTAHVPRKSWHTDYRVGDYMSVHVAQVLHLFGYLRKADVQLHLAAHRKLRVEQQRLREQQEALNNVFDAIGVLGIDVLKAEVDARAKMAEKQL